MDVNDNLEKLKGTKYSLRIFAKNIKYRHKVLAQ